MCAVETKAQQQSGRTQNQSNKVPVWPTLLTACLQERGYSEELGFDPHASSSKILNRSRSPWPTTLTGDLSANSVCRSLFCFSSLRVVLKIQLISVIDKSNQDEDLARNSPVNVQNVRGPLNCLQGDAIPRLFHAGPLLRGSYYGLCLELVGMNLARALKLGVSKERLKQGALEALQKLHAAKFLHGDIRPENICYQATTQRVSRFLSREIQFARCFSANMAVIDARRGVEEGFLRDCFIPLPTSESKVDLPMNAEM